MRGRAAVASQRQRLDETFSRIKDVDLDPELLSDYARYLCVRVSSFLEQAIIEIVLEHVRCQSSPSVLRHIESRLRKFTSANSGNIADLLGSFDLTWRANIEAFLVDEYKDAVNDIVGKRHRVAHGHNDGITIHQVRDYYARIIKVVDYIADLCLPAVT